MPAPLIRPQTRADLAMIANINEQAFAEHGGTASFDEIRAGRADILSLIAEIDGVAAGHVLFSPVTLSAAGGPVAGMGLGQLAVLPAYQNQGIGTHLSLTGIAELRRRGCPFIIVVGHAAYYPRFGFEPGHLHGVQCQWDGIPAETFMVLYLDQTEAQRQTLQGVASFDGL